MPEDEMNVAALLSANDKVIDEALGPLEDHRVIVLLARRGKGKTQLAVNAAMSSALQLRISGEPGQVVVFSMESRGMYRERAMSWVSGINNMHIARGFDPATHAQWANDLDESWPDLPAYPISDCEDVRDEDGIEAQLRLHARKYPIRMVVLDYWQALGRRSGRREVEEYDALALRFRDLADEYGVPFLICSQETFDKQSKVASAKNSKAIEEVATLVLRLSGDKDDVLSCEKLRKGFAFAATPLVINKGTSHAWTVEEHQRMAAIEQAARDVWADE